MKKYELIKSCLLVLAVLMLAVPVSAVEFEEVCDDTGCYFSPPTNRGEWKVFPIDTFLAQQGKFCLGSDRPDCILLDPPVPNMLFFEDTDDFKCASFDYAGLAGSFLRDRPKMDGLVRQRERADDLGVDGELVLETENGLAWVAQDCRLNTMLFGYRVSEILGGEGGVEPVFGKSRLQVLWLQPRSTADLFDLFKLYVLPELGRVVQFVYFAAEAQGTLRVQFNGIPAGTPVKLTLTSCQNFGNGGCFDTLIDLTPLEP